VSEIDDPNVAERAVSHDRYRRDSTASSCALSNEYQRDEFQMRRYTHTSDSHKIAGEDKLLMRKCRWK
jgi:hypothetical protein